MTRNVGTADRAVRIAVGVALLSLLVLLDGDARYWGLLGLLPLLTGAVGWCGPYALLGISTCREKPVKTA